MNETNILNAMNAMEVRLRDDIKGVRDKVDSLSVEQGKIEEKVKNHIESTPHGTKQDNGERTKGWLAMVELFTTAPKLWHVIVSFATVLVPVVAMAWKALK